MQLLWTPNALKDLRSISVFIEQRRNIATANRVCRLIYDTVQILRSFPETGKLGIDANTRELVVAKLPVYIVVYRIVSAGAVQIVRIRHSAQQRTH